MDKVINRVVKAYKSTRHLTEKQEVIVQEGISNIVASMIERQADKCRPATKTSSQVS